MSDEKMRKLIDLAIACGRKRQSPHTGFVHHLYHAHEDEPAVTIPLVENCLFALALFRSRTAETISEAKALLDRLLHFQSGGNFPVYLHEYPQCRDRTLGYQLLLPLYWISCQFHHILGQELKTRLEAAVRCLLDYALSTQESKPAQGPLGMKVAAAALAFGTLWKDDGLRARGEKTFALPDRSWWRSPAHLGELLATLQMVGNFPQDFWQHLSDTWHRPTCSYCGPAHKEYQQGYEPQPTLYDQYLGYFSDNLSSRALTDGIHLLQGALIQPSDQKMLPPQPFEGLYQGDQIAYTIADNASYPLRISWGGPKRLHTFVCQGGNTRTCQWRHEDDRIELLFDLAEPIQGEDREKSQEISFYLDLSDAHRISIGETPATTFHAGDDVIIESTPLRFSLKFEVVEGSGTFLGHLMKGNRPAQIGAKGDKRYHAYDWQIFLRTVRRTDPCRIRAVISYVAQ